MKEIWWRQILKSASGPRVINALKLIAALGLASLTHRRPVWGVPAVLTAEPSARCNLRCPQCLVGLGQIRRQQNLLDLDLFKNIIDQIGDRLWYLLLFNQGEPFLHPNFIELIHIAKQKGIYVSTSTNGHFLSDEVKLAQLVTSGLDVIIISLDGYDAASYSTYRQGGNFQRVVAGITNLIRIKKRLRSPTPRVVVQCLVTKHNEHRLPAMKQLAKQLGVDRLIFKTLQIEANETASEILPGRLHWRRYQSTDGTIHTQNSLKGKCWRLWYSAVLLSDGRIVPCCFDKNGKYAFGKVGPTPGIEQLWKSNVSQQFRTRVLHEQHTILICHNCTANQKIYL